MPGKLPKRLNRPTLADVASEAGVSMMTVSRAVRGMDNVDEQTRLRIMGIASNMGYLPNFSARTTVTGRFNTIALLLSSYDGRSTLPPRLLRGIQNEMISRAMNLVVSMLPDENLIEEWGAPTALTHRMCDGLLINYTHLIPKPLMESIQSHHIPTVWINTDQPHNAVRPDDVHGGRIATEYLCSHGHRRIAYVDFSSDWLPPDLRHYSHRDRFEGYMQVMREAGLPPILARRDSSLGVEERVGAILRLMRSPEPPTAYLCYGSSSYLGLAASAEGKWVGRDLSMMEFASESSNSFGDYSTTAISPDAPMGSAAVQMLLTRLQNPEINLPARLLPFIIDPGGTVRSV